ncbi:polygalacturonase-1 non-catalytic subunit beta-like [Trifolium medium]|uniref:Polygalacturonase-1 non-catalytic subunit beta-like n=1 Tax=Trifolium medium TaxID=97028 RepID=A0A392NMI6_9FABA|nr:polygalacturonase-1 non-catalytic subunit beta-like [Trifolium medium]
MQEEEDPAKFHQSLEGIFFRKYDLEEGKVMRMPDIRDNNPKRYFLPQSNVKNLPFSTSKKNEVKLLFKAATNSTFENMLMLSLTECEETVKGEVRKCVASIEDMVNFARTMLGKNIVVATTNNSQGWKNDVLIGQVNVTENTINNVVCHQELYPYLMYLCHYVPQSRAYRVEISHPRTKKIINQGIAACHLDTSNWNPEHLAFKVLGGSPSQFEICHWLMVNEFLWVGV